MLVAESRMVMGKAHVFHVGSLSYSIAQTIDFVNAISINIHEEWRFFISAWGSCPALSARNPALA